MDHRAIRHDGDFAAVSQNFALSDLEQLGLARDVGADAVAARIAHGGWSIVLQHREEHVAHLAFVFRGHDDDVRYGAKIRDVEQAVMCLAVAAGDAAAIETKLHVEILDADVVYEL